MTEKLVTGKLVELYAYGELVQAIEIKPVKHKVTSKTPKSKTPKLPCSIDECEKPVLSRGWCRNHYNSWLKYGDPLKAKRAVNNKGRLCSIEDCSKPAKAKGYCQHHYGRFLRYGDPLYVKPQPHGTRNGYQHYHCKCELCVEAHRKHMDSLKGKEPPKHGTSSAYWNYACRCDECKEAARKHNAAQAQKLPAEYSVWASMKSRCFNPKVTGYKYYGGRGITVCERWQNSFDNFLEDMGPRPAAEERLTIERIDNDGNYEPGNCKWATYKEQAANKHERGYLERLENEVSA